MNSCELLSFVTAIACAIAKCAPEEDLPMITAIFGQLSSSLATIAVHQETCEKKAKLEEENTKKEKQKNQDQQQESDPSTVPETDYFFNEGPELDLITIPPTIPPTVIRQDLN